MGEDGVKVTPSQQDIFLSVLRVRQQARDHTAALQSHGVSIATRIGFKWPELV